MCQFQRAETGNGRISRNVIVVTSDIDVRRSLKCFKTRDKNLAPETDVVVRDRPRNDGE